MSPEIHEVLAAPILRSDTVWEQIVTLVCVKTGISSKLVCSKSRKNHVVVARHVICYLARLHTLMGLAEIGARLNRDHTTVIYSVERVTVALQTNQAPYRAIVGHVTDQLNANSNPPWRLEIVDPDPQGKLDQGPGLRVIYTREDGTEWVAVLAMCRR